MDVSLIKKKLQAYSREQIKYNEPHVTIRCRRRHVSKKEIEQNLIDPINLKFAIKGKSLKGEKYNLIFQDKNRILEIPVVFKPKSLYVITIIKRIGKWEKRIKKWLRKKQI